MHISGFAIAAVVGLTITVYSCVNEEDILPHTAVGDRKLSLHGPSGTNATPAAVVDEVSIFLDTPLIPAPVNVLDNDTDPEGEALSAVLNLDVSNGNLTLNADGTFDYVPDLGFTGVDTFNYRASDGESLSAPTTVTITVAPPAVERTLIILIYHTDTTRVMPSVAEMETRIDTVSANFRQYSYNQITLQGVINPAKSADVVGWYEYSGTTCGTVRYDLADADVNYTQYDRLVFVNAAQPGCNPPAAFALIGKVMTSTPDGSTVVGLVQMTSSNAGVATLTHELGHTLGNHHGQFLDCGNDEFAASGCTTVPYGDPYDVMSLGQGHFSAPRLKGMGWLNGPNSLVQVSQSGTYEIAPIESNSGEVKALEIPHAIGQPLTIEYRQPIGSDATFDPAADAFLGGIFHLGIQLIDMSPPAGAYGPLPPTDAQLTPSLHVGNSFVDPDTGHSITIVSATPSALTVDVVMSRFELNAPTVSLDTPLEAATLSGVVSFEATVTDESDIATVDFTFTDSAFHTTTIATLPGHPGSLYQVVFDTVAAIPNGPGTVRAVAVDEWGNSASTGIVNVVVDNMTDVELPVIVVTAPLEGISTATNTVTIDAAAQDNSGIWKVEYFMDGDPQTPVHTVFGDSLFSAEILLLNGPRSVIARATDYEGNAKDSLPVAFTVVDLNDLTPPWIHVQPPFDPIVFPGPTVTGNQLISTIAGDNVDVISVDFRIDGMPVFTDFTAPFEFVWDSTMVPDGSHSLTIMAFDGSGNATMDSSNFDATNP